MKRDNRDEPKDERGFTQALRNVLNSRGWLLPESEEEVAAQEPLVDAMMTELPEVLRDAAAILQPLDRTDPRPARSSPLPEDIEESLARAAREGQGEVPPEIEERMRRDRAEAEKQEHAGGE